MKRWLDLWNRARGMETVLGGLKKGWLQQMVDGLTSSSTAYLVSYLAAATGRPCLVVTPTGADARALASDISFWSGAGSDSGLFPSLEVLPGEVLAHNPDLEGQRLAVLEKTTLNGESGPYVVTTPVSALARRLCPPDRFSAAISTLRGGDTVDMDALSRDLVAAGYERCELVSAPGTFSVRGGIVDIYPPAIERPVRIELFGDEIESVRIFDPVSQRSEESLDRVTVGPARELIYTPRDAERAVAAIREAAGRHPGGECRDRALESADIIESGGAPGALASYLPYFFSGSHLLLDYLPERALVVMWEPARFAESFREAEADLVLRAGDLIERGDILPGQADVYEDFSRVWSRLVGRQAVLCQGLTGTVDGASPGNILSIGAREIPSSGGQWAVAVDTLSRLTSRGLSVLAVVGAAERADRLRDTLEEEGLRAEIRPGGAPPLPGIVSLAVGNVADGFEIPGTAVAVVGETGLFGRRRRRTPVRGRKAGARALLADLSVGDYVVHVHHGVGQYTGLRTQVVDGVTKEYLYLRYAGGDRLYVPVDQIEMVQKYVGQEGRGPSLHRLGTAEWSRVKSRVRKSVREMARELLSLYATREKSVGHAFSPDGPWQSEFEDAFAYEETPDQLRAAAEIKADMERPRPMDRLLCADVGYGKTEVAIRAAFKAVMDGKQVACLVPTTILGQQHFLTFSERFADYPMKVALLSRFRTPSEQARTLDGLRRGSVDIVVGTHRLLGADVEFRDLGLLIVDEEHRFGVAHKEKLKRLRHTVDVLTLTATPIPRTLHMALSGLRDMSVIETPPPGRRPVETYVVEHNDSLVRHALRRELERGGQVYYVHNRVRTLDHAQHRLRTLVPGARIGVGHGQMREDGLERVMLRFVDGEHDILLSTTIIESGLDIPNVNTLVVEDSDNLGLAQLYQLRGRVGRSPRQAYCYLTYRRNRVLSEIADKRLRAIKDFTELGAGFRIALRDLEIRGAGNILGPEQHGFMISVGFDLYCQLLEEAVRELKGDRADDGVMPVVELPVDAYLPDDYIPDPRQKVAAYKRVNTAGAGDDLDDVGTEWRDRYGPPPPPALNLLRLAALKQACRRLGVSRLAVDGPNLVVFSTRAPQEEVVAIGNGLRYLLGQSVAARTGDARGIVLRHGGISGRDLLSRVEEVVTAWDGIRERERGPVRE